MRHFGCPDCEAFLSLCITHVDINEDAPLRMPRLENEVHHRGLAMVVPNDVGSLRPNAVALPNECGRVLPTRHLRAFSWGTCAGRRMCQCHVKCSRWQDAMWPSHCTSCVCQCHALHPLAGDMWHSHCLALCCNIAILLYRWLRSCTSLSSTGAGAVIQHTTH